MKNQDCKIVCNGKEAATVKCSKDGISIDFTEAGKAMCKDQCIGCC
jgi:hypothetical protein